MSFTLSRIENLERRVASLKGQQLQVSKDLSKAQERLEALRTRSEDIEKAQTILQGLAKMTQDQLVYRVSELVSLAMEAVFEDPYKMEIDFTLRRNRTEADISFSRAGTKIHPLSASGGGAVDLAAFALRVTAWSLMSPRKRAVIILDEPFRFLSRDMQDKASRLLSELSNRLHLQFIMVSHNPELIEGAHRIFKVSKRGEISKVEIL